MHEDGRSLFYIGLRENKPGRRAGSDSLRAGRLIF